VATGRLDDELWRLIEPLLPPLLSPSRAGWRGTGGRSRARVSRTLIHTTSTATETGSGVRAKESS
jgi:hypothetical protein